MADYEVYDLGDFALQNGAMLRGCQLAYKSFGKLNAKRDNVIVYPTWYSGQHVDNEWLIGKGMALEPGPCQKVRPGSSRSCPPTCRESR